MEERKKAIQNLKVAKGQIEGIIKMIEDERYCVDISNQIIAVQSLLKKSIYVILLYYFFQPFYNKLLCITLTFYHFINFIVSL